MLQAGVTGEELFLSYGEGFWGFQRDSFRAIKREKREKQEGEQVIDHVLLPQVGKHPWLSRLPSL